MSVRQARSVHPLSSLSLHRVLALVAMGTMPCACSNETEAHARASSSQNQTGANTAQGRMEEAREETERPDPYAGFPLYGLVTGTQLTIHENPDPDSLVIGWLRKGEQVRLRPDVTKTSTCNTGWYPLHPKGYACAGVGIRVEDAPIEVAPELRAQAKRDQALPYDYYFVKDYKVPEFFQLPSRSQQKQAEEYGARWQTLLSDEKQARALKRFLSGEAKNEPRSPASARRYLDRGFFVASTGIEIRRQRRFVRTVRGTYIRESQLLRRESPTFEGVALKDGEKLPIAWAVRTGRPLKPLEKWDGEIKWREQEDMEPIERLTRLTQWKGQVHFGKHLVHELEGDVYLRDWYVAVAERIAPPRGIAEDEPWVHVDLGEQTLVLYRGREPVFATLVSTGLAEHATPTGEFQIMRKYVSDTMSDIGADAPGDRYSIDDVPWTQYFSGSLALHGAFWHERFGMQRSHGCVNISPPDARRVFDHTWPVVPEGWHGVSTFKTGFRSSRVLITE